MQGGAATPFFTNNLEGWLKILGLLSTVGLMIWGMLKGKLQQDINGVGNRVAELEKLYERGDDTLAHVQLDIREGRSERTHMQTQIGEVRKAQETLDTTLREMQNAIVTEIHRTRDAVHETNMQLRERIVRLETISQLERFLGKSIIELKENNHA